MIVIVLIALFLIMLTSKNMITMTAIAGILGWGLTKKLNLKRWIIMIILGIGLATVLFYSPLKNRWHQELGSNINEVLTSESFDLHYPWTGTTLRVFQTRVCYELIDEQKAFLNGFGINASQKKIAEKQEQYQLYCGFNTYDFHNQYVQAFAELGIFGLLLLLLLLFVILKDYLKHKEIISFFFFIIMASIFITESYLWRQRGMIFFLVIYCLLIKIQPKINQLKSKA